MTALNKIVPDWSWGPGSSPATGALITAAGCASGAMTAACLGAPWWGVAAGGALVSTYAAASAAYREQPARVIGYRAGTWAAGTLWASTSVALTNAEHLWGSGPWSSWAAGTLAAGALAFASLGAWLSRVQRKSDDGTAEPVRLDLDKEDTIAAAWQQLLRKITRHQLTVVGVELWASGKGFTLDVDLPATGVTMMDVKGYELALATAANLPTGCNVEVIASEVGRRSCLIRVATSNALVDTHTLPKDYAPSRIADPISLGVQSDGAEQHVTVNYRTTVMIGQKDSGKSTELNVITKGIVCTTDAIIIGIDTTGRGRAFRPWVRAWFEGRCPRPAIDLVAADDEMALAVCKGVRNVIAGRTAAYQGRMYRENSDKIVPAPDLPAIIVMVDEYGTLSQAVKDALVDISDTGRGAAVSVVVCALRAKEPYLSRNMIAQAFNRLAMRVVDEAELQMLFDATWRRGRFDPASMPYAGVGVCAEGATVANGFKGWWQDPRDIDDAAIAVSDRRPPLDDISAQLMDEAMGGRYSRRWDITLPLMFPADTTPKPRQAPAAPAGGIALKELPVTSLEDAEADMRRAVEAARAARAAADAEYAAEQAAGSDRDAEVARLNALYEASPDADPRALPAAGHTGTAPARDRVRQLVTAVGPAGIGASKLEDLLRAEGYPTNRQTIARWLKQDLAAGLIAQPGGDKTPYVAKEHL